MLEEILKIAFLALLQGITEFLPVSSSGHLALFGQLLGVKDGVVVAVVLHAGTMVAVLVVYGRELINLLRPERRRLLLQVLVATAMVGVVGLAAERLKLDELLFEQNLLVPGLGFLVTAALLRFGLERQAQEVALERMPWPVALRIGLMQVLAILPGVSRSGSTITTGLRNRMKREGAATFSFLLMVPAVSGACLVKLYSWWSMPDPDLPSGWALLMGFVLAGIIGFAAINILLNSVRRGKFRVYSWYCLALGIVTLGVECWSRFGAGAR